MKNEFIKTLPAKTQEEIYKDLKNKGLTEEDINNAMDSRLSDLEDTIDITNYTK